MVSQIYATYMRLCSRQRRDDPVEKYIPDLVYNNGGFTASNSTAPKPPITIRHLATHLSGIGRDWPPGTVSHFPQSLFGAGPPPANGLPFPTHQVVLNAIAEYKLISPPGKVPAYSNAATSLLGRVVVEASRRSGVEVKDFAELMQKDVFEPLGMVGSGFEVTGKNVVVPSLAPEVVVRSAPAHIAHTPTTDTYTPSRTKTSSTR